MSDDDNYTTDEPYTPPGKATFFVTALTLPLSIAGALLTVVGVCVLVFRLRLMRRGE